ncbi:ribonuclease E/G [Magnetovibrio sp.]|uniref:Rne/Rng family ribonuclease n=1 Tax=Magnetovibrio sp. TaxID=2024836 RepID=UPI002F957338
MTKRMLIDATHPEETRVALVDGNQLEDFDVEVSSRRQLKGNIYLAKVVRVEPSLQAAFVDYGGNRHGFLAFSEIHPDYYQIPVADREEAEAHHAAEEAVHEDAPEHVDADATPAGDEDDHGEDVDPGENAENGELDIEPENGNGGSVETVGGDETDEVGETHHRRQPSAKQYKIQEVIKRRQVLLIQVVKEERGNKGAALTTYMSLAGRYCVLMPNTARGGGISRKITNSADRKSLKAILSSLDVPHGMAVILRTAGIGRTKAEIKRDFEYLIRLWNNVRDLTLQSTAPTLVHEEGDIVRRSIRDLYSRDIEDIQVEGEEAYRAAKEFMKLLIPSHARRVKLYKETSAPLFRSAGVENQLDAIHNPVVHLPSGGYLVINPTEALVSIDVNSGRSTKERNIEETAVKTNLEAADEVARQLRLRDLAGLVVIDFIDMDVNRNNSQVERRMKEALKHDRARIQVGRISPFGLLEMSRQRLRPSLIETSSEPCPHCGGTGIRRSTESTALVVLRAIDEEGANRRAAELTVHVPTSVALYILNHKRDALAELEAKYGMQVMLTNDDSLVPPDLRLERTKNQNGETISEMVANVRPDVAEDAGRKRKRRRRGRKRDDMDGLDTQYDAADAAEDEIEAGDEETVETAETAETGEEGKSKRRRRSRRGGRRRRKSIDAATEAAEGAEPGDTTDEAGDSETVSGADEDNLETAAMASGEERPKRRRSRRRRKPAGAETGEPANSNDETAEDVAIAADETVSDAVEGEVSEGGEEKPKRRRRSRRKPAAAEAAADTAVADDATEAVADDVQADAQAEDDTDKPKRRSRARKKPEPAVEAETVVEAEAETEVAAETEPQVTAPEPAVAEPAAEEPAAEESAAAEPLAPAPVPGVETVVVGEVAEKPKRKGWWNLGG